MIESDTLTVRKLRVEELSEAEQRKWDEICLSSERYASAFYSRSFALAVSLAAPRVHVFVFMRSGEPVAFLPVQFSHGRHEMLASAERVGLHLSDYFGLIAVPDFHITPERLLRLSGLSRIDFSHLDEWHSKIGLTGDRRGYGIIYDVSDGPDRYWEYVRERDKRFLAHTLRQERRIEKELGELRLVFDHRDDEAALSSLIAQKREQYRLTGVDDALRSKWSRDCLANLYRTRSGGCSGVLSMLYAGEVLVSSHFGLRCRDTLHIWFPVYGVEFGKFSPGRLLLKSLIDACPARGIRYLDDGEAHDSQQQKRLMGNRRHEYQRGHWSTPSFRGLLASTDRALAWRLDKLKASGDQG